MPYTFGQPRKCNNSWGEGRAVCCHTSMILVSLQVLGLVLGVLSSLLKEAWLNHAEGF